MSAIPVVPLSALFVVLALMLVELWISRSNERILRRLGATDVADHVYHSMQWAYPGSFVLMALEGAIRETRPGLVTWCGVALFLAAKALKGWAIVSLGSRWTYRVLVLPGAPLVTRGPYAFMRHPNYVGVIGELIGMALMVGAPIAGPLSTLFFALLLRRRIAAEERALGFPGY
jgi:methyltransferase